MPEYLIFTLVAPMGSFGDLAGHERRGSHDWPGRGAILGLIGASLGIRRDNTTGQAELGLWQTAIAKLMPSRPFRDFHTVQTVPSAISKRPDTRRSAVTAAGQKINTIVTQRDYHMDCVFGVAVWGGTDAPAVENALRKPRFVPYLGRKSCPLSAPMAPKIVDADAPVAALRLVTLPPFWPKDRTGKNAPDSARPLLIASDAPFGGGRVETRWDVPIDRETWHFGSRRVHVSTGSELE